jgi:hypothetical protein
MGSVIQPECAIAGRRPIPDTRDQARKRCHARQQNLLFDQPCGGQVEQRDRSLRTDPGSSVEPPQVAFGG